MSTFKTIELIADLEKELSIIKATAYQLQAIDAAVLTTQPGVDKWSVAQVLEHLNSYNRYYLPEIEKTLVRAEQAGSKCQPDYNSGWLGDYFVKTMYSQIKQSNKVANKMNAPKEHCPETGLNSQKVLTEFLNGVIKLEALLVRAKKVNIEKAKTPISIAKWLKIRLGDTFRFLIAHKIRHFIQISNALAVVSK
jgi:hypothetical protein